MERAAPTRPAIPGHDKKIEYNYIRHGTEALLTGLNIGTGRIFGCCLPTRTEEDFAAFVEALVQGHPQLS